MINANDLTEAFNRNTNIIKSQTKDLSHEDSLLQPPFGGNCLNWVLGHIAENRNTILGLLGEQPQAAAPGIRYERGSEPITVAGEEVLPLKDLLAWNERMQELIAVAIARMDDAGWARVITLSNNRTMTVGQRVFFLYFHETFHIGQTEMFRQLAGKHDRVI